MAVNIILGGTGQGKTEYVINQMLPPKAQAGRLVFYIVPEQYTLKAQQQLLTKCDSLLNVEVLSFHRLIYRFAANLPLHNAQPLNETGKSMLIRKLIDQNKKRFQWLHQYHRQQAYIQQLTGLIEELYQYSITPPDLHRMVEAMEQGLLKNKLMDLAVLLELYQDCLNQDYLSLEQATKILIEQMGEMKEMAEIEVVIDGFYSFTPIQYRIIEQLICYSRQFTICITIPKTEKITDLRDEQSLFYDSKLMISKINDIGLKLERQLPNQIWVENSAQISSDLQHLAAHLYHYPLVKYDSDKGQPNIKLTAAIDIHAEVEKVAIQIHHLIREEQYRYREIVVLTSDVEMYEPIVRKQFSNYQLNYFIDKKEGILDHPLAQFLQSILLIIKSNFKYEDVFYHLKSAFYPATEAIHQIENYVLSHGIRGFESYRQDWPQYNQEKNQLFESVFDFYGQIRAGQTIQAKASALYQYVEAVSRYQPEPEAALVDSDFNYLQKQDADQKVYNLVIDLLDEMVGLIGDEAITDQEFADLVETGLGQIKMGQAPAGVDELLVGDLTRTRIGTTRALFVLGVNDGYVPYVLSQNSLITDFEREQIKGYGLDLAPTQKESLFKEQIKIYMALTKPTEKLYVSYPEQNDQDSLRPADVFYQLKRLYPSYGVDLYRNQEFDWIRLKPAFEKYAKQLSLAGRPEGKTDLTDREISYGYGLFRYAYTQSEVPNPEILIQGLCYQNQTDQLETIQTEDFSCSISQLEVYAGCPFAYYIKYRLRLKQRDQYVVTNPDIGLLFHKGLELFFKKCIADQLDINRLEPSLSDLILDQSVEQTLQAQNSIFLSSATYRYLLIKLKRMLRRTVWAIGRQLEQTALRPQQVEYRFDSKQDGLDGYALPNGKQMHLNGVIDRIDEKESPNQTEFSIIDYKSGKKEVDFSLIYGGIQLQLVVYLEMVWRLRAKNQRKSVQPVGMYYYHIKDPIVKLDQNQNVEQQLLKELRPTGISIGQDQALTHSELKKITDFVETKQIQIGSNIVQGQIAMEPYKYENKTNCDYCDYRPICRFDATNPNEHYRMVEKLKKEEMLERVSDSGGTD